MKLVKDLTNKMEEDKRPGLVVFVIVTDGENASHEFTKSQIKEMIEKQQSDLAGNLHSLVQIKMRLLKQTGLGIG